MIARFLNEQIFLLMLLSLFLDLQMLQESLEEQQMQVNSLTHMVVVVDESSPENGESLDFLGFRCQC